MKERLDREVIAMRAAKELNDGDYVNLGIGIPNLCALFVQEGVLFQTENGALGYGPLVMQDEIDRADQHYVDAGGRYWTPVPGMALFDIVTSFAMIRSGRLITVLGGLQVSEDGDLANWNKGSGALGGTIGGSMDLAFGAKKVVITMEHTTKENQPKIVKKCSYPITSKNCVDLIITDLAVIELKAGKMILKEAAPGWTSEEIQDLTEPKLIVDKDFKEMELA